MAFEYQELDKSARDRVRARIAAPDPEPAYEDFLATWEEAHVAHRALRDAAVADGNAEEAAAQESAIATLEASITNVRAGLRPDGTERPTPPAPPTPAPVTPTPVEPAPPAPAEPTDPARPTAR